MLIEQSEHEVSTATGPMTVFVVKPKYVLQSLIHEQLNRCLDYGHFSLSNYSAPRPTVDWPADESGADSGRACYNRLPEYPNAKFPGVVVWSEIYNVTGPVLRFANSIASQGYIVACPVVFHEWTGPAAIAYDGPGTDAGNKYKIEKLLTAYDEDAKKAVNLLMEHKNCNGRIGSTGMCLGGHLAFRNALDPRIKASVCYFPTDIHDAALSSTGDDSLSRASQGEIQGELVLIFGVQDGHIPSEGRTKIRSALSSTATKFSFLELQANHAFIRDEMSKGRFDAAISKVCFELLLETFSRTIARDLGEKVEEKKGDDKLVC